MNHLLALAPALLVAATKATTKTSSSSYTFLIFIVIIVAALYFLFLRPNQQKAKRQREENASIGVGDRIVTIGGIVGTIEEMRGDRVVLSTEHPELDGAGEVVRLLLLRSAVARKVDAGAAPEPEHDDATGEGAEDHEADETGRAEGTQE